jgi:protein AFG1
MNLFYDSITDGPWAASKQKVHFHAFMLNVHAQMHQARYAPRDKQQAQLGGSDAIIPIVIHNILAQGHLICFDEFQVTDVADALILQRIFEGIWRAGGVVVATSNRPPKDLYLNGIQRDRVFLPFIKLLERKCHVVDMWKSDTDYRLLQQKSAHGSVYFVGNDGRTAFDQLFYDLVGGTAVAPTYLHTQGRRVNIPQAAIVKGIARFTFEDLCQRALGAADYLVIGEHFHTVFVERIPVLTLNELNWVRRFIIFVDSMYECHVKLVLQAQTDRANIFQRPVNDGDHDEVFAFDRTLSRLEEISSQTYLQKAWSGKGKLVEAMEDLRSSSQISVEPVHSADYTYDTARDSKQGTPR